MVYVISRDGQPLMPTERHGKVRRLLKFGKAKVIKRCPFTIQLLYETGSEVQETTLGVDAGSRVIGLSATTEQKELYAANIELRTDIVELLSSRREDRRGRRNRKTRYRKPRFDNRRRRDGWLAPSVQQRGDCHLQVIASVCRILPVSKIVIETASFDIQKIKNPEISGTEYQQGEQLHFWNVREYVLFRDGHVCQCCRGRSGDKTLNVHHIESRKTGGDSPSNLITLCSTCHKAYHAGTIRLPDKIRRGNSFQDEAFMGIMRWTVYNRLKEIYPSVQMTYGYITKNTRIQNGLPKEHYVDARCISGNPGAKPLDFYYYQKKIRCHNRQIHKRNTLKGGVRKKNQAAYEVHGFRLFDKVLFAGTECFIWGRRTSGYFDLRLLSGECIHRSANAKKLHLLEKRKPYLTERRLAIPPSPIEDEGILAR